MVFAGLSLDQAPPYSATMKFFITGFIYALFGGVYLAFGGGVIDTVFIHLMTIGFMTMVMSGAVFQFLPVVGGVRFQRIILLSNLIYTGLNLGVIGFSVGFYFYNPILLRVSSTILLLSIGLFALSVIYKLFENRVKNLSIISIALALVFLLLGAVAGVWMTHFYAGANIGESFLWVKNIHLHLLFFGWIVLLVMGVSFQVIPMFWVAKDFHTKTKALFIFILAGLLVGYLFFVHPIFSLALALWVMVYAFVVLHRLSNRKRKLRDYSVNYWFVAMGSLAIAMTLFIFDFAVQMSYKMMAFGFVYAVISAMIYKIIPFITWFHLSAKGIFEIPTMKEMIGQNQIKYSFYLFVVIYLAFILSNYHIMAQTLFIYGFIALNAWHIVNFWGVLRLYKKYL